MRVSSPTQTARPGWKKTLKVECPHCGEVHGFPSVKLATLRLRSKIAFHPECCLSLPKRFIPRKPPKRIHASGKQRETV